MLCFMAHKQPQMTSEKLKSELLVMMKQMVKSSLAPFTMTAANQGALKKRTQI